MASTYFNLFLHSVIHAWRTVLMYKVSSSRLLIPLCHIPSNETSSPFIFQGNKFIHHSLVCSCLNTGSGFSVVTYFACDLMKYLGQNVLSYTLFDLKVRKLILVVGDLTFLCASRTSWDSYLKNIFILLLLLLYNKYRYYHWFSSHAFSHMCEACLICCPCKNASSNQTVSGNTSTCNL